MNKTVYLLGSGASAASDFSLSTTDRLLDSPLLESGGYDQLIGFIKKYFPNLQMAEINVEDLITYIEFSDERFTLFGEATKPQITIIRNELERFLQERLSVPENGKTYCEKHLRLFEDFSKAECQDSIITVNYDLVVDKTLVEVWKNRSGSQGPFILENMYQILGETTYWDATPFTIHHPSYYLKLHGSLGWYSCPSPECKNHQYFFANQLIPNGFPGTSGSDVCQICGSRATLVLIPPVLNKSFGRYPKLGFLWTQAYRELRKADCVVIVGLSFRDTDFHLRWLVKSSLLEPRENRPRKIIVIDTQKDIFDRIQKLIGQKDEFKYFSNLDEYLDRKLTLKNR